MNLFRTLPRQRPEASDVHTSHPVDSEVLFQGVDPLTADLVFVHGLRGHRRNTWTKDNVCWPQELLSKEEPLSHIRVLTLGYDANIVNINGRASLNTFFEHSINLVQELSRVRGRDARDRPIIFVAHSLGGLIVKDALDYSNRVQDTHPHLAQISSVTRGIIFLGTPHRGSGMTSIAKIVDSVAKVVLQNPHLDRIRDLGRDLDRIGDNFSRLLDKRTFAVWSFSEELAMTGIGKVVPTESAIIGDPRENRETIYGDHISMVRFSRQDDAGYKKVLNSIEMMLEGLGEDSRIPSILPNPDDAHKEQPLNIQLLRLQDEILTVARLYFGYTPRIPVPDVPALTDEKCRKSFCRSFGLIWDQVKPVDEVFAIRPVAAAIDFFLRLAKKSPLLADEWDLILDNPFHVSIHPRFRQFRLLQTKILFKRDESGPQTKEVTIYMLDLGTKSTAPWKLAVKSALDALMICRLDPAFNEYDIVEFLLTNGIPFHTLQPLSSISRALLDQRASLAPYRRPHNYDFESRDYLAYRERCHSILSHPRGRAALMHGHFMWRIALRSVRWEAVYNGPSGWSPNPDEMLIIQDPSTGMEYLDDKLSLDEQDALCGTYLYPIGCGTTIKSWYMPSHMYEKSNQWLGRWSPHTESLFHLLDQTFEDGKASITRGPHTRTTWDNHARSSLDIRKARMRLESDAVHLFRNRH